MTPNFRFWILDFRFAAIQNPKSKIKNVIRMALGGQVTLEFALVVAVVAAALLSMAIYLKRSVSGKLREGADSVGEQYHPTQTSGHHELVVNSAVVTTSTLKLNQPVGNGQTGDVMEYATTIDHDTSTKTGNETVGALGTDVWN